jgi:hypothetical protein
VLTTSTRNRVMAVGVDALCLALALLAHSADLWLGSGELRDQPSP